MYYVFHGVLRERPYEIMVLALATGVVLLYSILNYALSKQDTVKLVSYAVEILAVIIMKSSWKSVWLGEKDRLCITEIVLGMA